MITSSNMYNNKKVIKILKNIFNNEIINLFQQLNT